MPIAKMITMRCRFCGVPIKPCECPADNGRTHWQTEWEPLGEGVTYCLGADWKRQHEPGVIARDLR